MLHRCPPVRSAAIPSRRNSQNGRFARQQLRQIVRQNTVDVAKSARRATFSKVVAARSRRGPRHLLPSGPLCLPPSTGARWHFTGQRVDQQAPEILLTAARHIRNWCIEHGVGRRVGGGQWVVSNVALAMFLDGDDVVLTAHKEGNRSTTAWSPTSEEKLEGLLENCGNLVQSGTPRQT